MIPKQRKLLEPFGDVLANWDQQIIDMTPEERADLRAACEAVTTTNVCCCIYDAAKVLLPMIRRRDEFLKRSAHQ